MFTYLHRYNHCLLHLFVSQVMRKATYKGGVSFQKSWPLDSTTVFGMLAILGCMCKAPTLSRETIKCISEIIGSLEEHMCLQETLHLVPNKPKYNVEIIQNKIALRSLKPVFEKLSISFSRFLDIK